MTVQMSSVPAWLLAVPDGLEFDGDWDGDWIVILIRSGQRALSICFSLLSLTRHMHPPSHFYWSQPYFADILRNRNMRT